MKHACILVALIASGTCTCATFLHAQAPSNEDQFKAAFQAYAEGVLAEKNLETARQRGDDAAVVAVMSKRNLDVRLEAMRIVADLPPDRARPALIAVLNNEQLWSERVLMGSEAPTLQALFVNVMRKSILQVFGVDATDCDPFDGAQRAKLLAKLKTK